MNWLAKIGIVCYVIFKIVLLVWAAGNFLINDRNELSTLWYGMLLMILICVEKKE